MRLMQKSAAYAFAVISLARILGCSPTQPDSYNTALKVLKEFDKSRTFDTTGGSNAPLHFRPVKIDLFYPSTEKPGTAALTFGDVLDMYEQRMDYGVSPDSCKKVSAGLADAIGSYLHVDSPGKILDYKTGIYSNLALPVGKHPLIIYAAGMNGSSWENIVLFDSLAKAGYVVAAISSIGKFPGFMSSAIDLDEQVQDILYTRKRMAELPFIDTGKIGLLSWSLGGSAITKAAMISPGIKCLLSFDGTEIHYYGLDTAWDKEFREIMTIAPYNPEAISVPYMYLSSSHPKNSDSVYIFPSYIASAHKYFLQFNNGIHEDFSSIVTIAKKVDPKIGNADSSRHEIVCRLALTFFNQYLQQGPEGSTINYISRLIATKPGSFTREYPHNK